MHGETIKTAYRSFSHQGLGLLTEVKNFMENNCEDTATHIQ